MQPSVSRQMPCRVVFLPAMRTKLQHMQARGRATWPTLARDVSPNVGPAVPWPLRIQPMEVLIEGILGQVGGPWSWESVAESLHILGDPPHRSYSGLAYVLCMYAPSFPSPWNWKEIILASHTWKRMSVGHFMTGRPSCNPACTSDLICSSAGEGN